MSVYSQEKPMGCNKNASTFVTPLCDQRCLSAALLRSSMLPGIKLVVDPLQGLSTSVANCGNRQMYRNDQQPLAESDHHTGQNLWQLKMWITWCKANLEHTSGHTAGRCRTASSHFGRTDHCSQKGVFHRNLPGLFLIT